MSDATPGGNPPGQMGGGRIPGDHGRPPSCIGTAPGAVKSPPPSASSRAAGSNGEHRRTDRDVPEEPLVVLPPELVPLGPEEERRAVELLAELLASLLERWADSSPIHDE